MAKKKAAAHDPEQVIREFAEKAHADHVAGPASRGVDVSAAFNTADKIAALLRSFYQSLVAAGVVK